MRTKLESSLRKSALSVFQTQQQLGTVVHTGNPRAAAKNKKVKMLTRGKIRNASPLVKGLNEEPTLEAAKETATNAAEENVPPASVKPGTKTESDRQQIELVKKYYKQAGFSGSFAGVQSMQRALWSDKGLNVSQKIIAKAMHEVIFGCKYAAV